MSWAGNISHYANPFGAYSSAYREARKQSFDIMLKTHQMEMQNQKMAMTAEKHAGDVENQSLVNQGLRADLAERNADGSPKTPKTLGTSAPGHPNFASAPTPLIPVQGDQGRPPIMDAATQVQRALPAPQNQGVNPHGLTIPRLSGSTQPQAPKVLPYRPSEEEVPSPRQTIDLWSPARNRERFDAGPILKPLTMNPDPSPLEDCSKFASNEPDEEQDTHGFGEGFDIG